MRCRVVSNLIDFCAFATAREYPIRLLSAPSPGTFGMLYSRECEPIGRGYIDRARYGIDGTFLTVMVNGRRIPARAWQFVPDESQTAANLHS